MSYDTERIIEEVKIRRILWSLNSQRYSDKVARKNAWDEIAKVFHDDWQNFTPSEKREKVTQIMKKWRNVRDYYIKEKKRTADSNSPGAKQKKKYNYYDSLSFLDVMEKRKRKVNDNSSEEMNDPIKDEITTEYLILDDTQTNDVMSHEQYSDCTEEEEDSIDSSSTATSQIIQREKEEAVTSKPTKSFETHIIAPSGRSQDDHVKANKNFLLSLLPDITSLNERQNMKFRLGVLNLLNDIKFEPN